MSYVSNKIEKKNPSEYSEQKMYSNMNIIERHERFNEDFHVPGLEKFSVLKIKFYDKSFWYCAY